MVATKVLVAQLGARMHYAVPRLLHQEGYLSALYTDICGVTGWLRALRYFPSSILPRALKALLGRVPAGIPVEKINEFSSFGLWYAYRRSRAASLSEMSEIHLWAGKEFGKLIARRGLRDSTVVYGFNTASEELFLAAKQRGLACVLEQTIAPKLSELNIVNTETRKFPMWGDLLEDANSPKIACREFNEWKLADQILVASEFVKEECAKQGAPISKICVVPYGVDLNKFKADRVTRDARGTSNSLRVLFVGTIGLRKGIPSLVEAIRLIEKDNVSCRLVGQISNDVKPLLKNLPSNVQCVGPVPRNEIKKEYEEADVFCLPSLCEGSATVVYEALASGLPVITTKNAGSIVRDGVEGFIVPLSSATEITNRLLQLHSDRNLLAKMSSAAEARSEFGSMEAYKDRLLAALLSV